MASAGKKSLSQLLDYEKTDMIEPGESQTVTITADAQDMASWDSTCDNEAGTTGNWIHTMWEAVPADPDIISSRSGILPEIIFI